MLRAVLAGLTFLLVLDRVVISVGLTAITESQLKEEIAVTAFLNGDPIQDTPEQRRAAAHRLVDQTLLAKDMALAHFPGTEDAHLDASMDRIEKGFGAPADFASALKRYGLTSEVVRAHVETQLATLRFIEYRFRPDLGISDDELHRAYEKRSATWDQDHPGAAMPSFEQSRASLRTELVEQHTDEALDEWLKQTETQTRVVYEDPSLRPEQ